MHGSKAPAEGSMSFVLQNVNILKSFIWVSKLPFGVRPGPQSCYFAFFTSAQPKWRLPFSALSEALIIFKFFHTLGQSWTQLM